MDIGNENQAMVRPSSLLLNEQLVPSVRKQQQSQQTWRQWGYVTAQIMEAYTPPPDMFEMENLFEVELLDLVVFDPTIPPPPLPWLDENHQPFFLELPATVNHPGEIAMYRLYIETSAV